MTKKVQTSQHIASGQSNIPAATASNSEQSSPRKWREWDAAKADAALQEIQLKINSSTANTAAKFPILKETHRPVTIKNGSRVRLIKGTTCDELGDEASAQTYHPNKSHQQIDITKALLKPRNNKRPSVQVISALTTAVYKSDIGISISSSGDNDEDLISFD